MRLEPTPAGWVRTMIEVGDDDREIPIDVRTLPPAEAAALRELRARADAERQSAGMWPPAPRPATAQLYALVNGSVSFPDPRHERNYGDRTGPAKLAALLRVNS